VIPKETVDKIIETARVEEVLGDFITLKKRGTNLLGLCPFHGEKTPSFTVSPVKGIYKCFGCGKAGNSVNFIMEHLQLTYPEALKWLAKKYGIEVVEREITPEEKEKQTERESMLIVMQYAQRYFNEMMTTTDEGKSVGLGYFKQRELTEAIIKKFQLGYSLAERIAFTQTAIKAGYKAKYLASTGMSILSNNHVEGTEIANNEVFDRYAGRVMFPIHDDGGRVVAFGGRILTNDKKVAKYINSPETDIYNKSKILYGLWLSKKAIQQNDACYLVEGYMDVIAMHQAGIENVVASSGTSLTVEQIKSIHRFTKNIVVLYDGDEAGQKASNRAIPLLLEEGMNVRLLFFPDNDDPDSFSRKVTNQEFKEYITTNTEDFLYFKAKKLNTQTKNDPIKKAGVIKDIVESIAIIPDNIIRSIYVKECANIMELEEVILQQEVNKIRRKSLPRGTRESEETKENKGAEETEGIEGTERIINTEETEVLNVDAEEKDFLRLLLSYGTKIITVPVENEDFEEVGWEMPLGQFIYYLVKDENQMEFENPIHIEVFEEFINQYRTNTIPELKFFANHHNPIISSFVINHVHINYELSKGWKIHGVIVPKEIDRVKESSLRILTSYAARKSSQLIKEKQQSLKTAEYNEVEIILKEIKRLLTFKIRVNKLLGRVIIK
jgi:DNA primase